MVFGVGALALGVGWWVPFGLVGLELASFGLVGFGEEGLKSSGVNVLLFTSSRIVCLSVALCMTLNSLGLFSTEDSELSLLQS